MTEVLSCISLDQWPEYGPCRKVRMAFGAWSLGDANMFDFFDRFSTGFSAASDCWEVLKKDKKLLLFPLVSGLACFVVLLSFAIPIAVLRPQELQGFLDEE